MTEPAAEPVPRSLIARPEPVPHDPERGGDHDDLLAAWNQEFPLAEPAPQNKPA